MCKREEGVIMTPQEKELEGMYRKYSNAKMLEAMNDAMAIINTFTEDVNFKITESDDLLNAITKVATKLFQSRISPYHFWQQKKKVEIMEMKKAEEKEEVSQ